MLMTPDDQVEVVRNEGRRDVVGGAVLGSER